MKRIVLIDDDDNIREIFQIAFHENYQVTGLANGDAVLTRSIAAPGLFVLDNMRCGLAGLDLCRFIKADALYGQTPVIILSAMRNIIALGKAAGADMVIEKPFCLNYLQEQVDRLTTYIHKAGAGRRQLFHQQQ